MCSADILRACSSVVPARHARQLAGVAGGERYPDPPALTLPICECSSVVERYPDKIEVGGSIPPTRKAKAKSGVVR